MKHNSLHCTAERQQRPWVPGTKFPARACRMQASELDPQDQPCNPVITPPSLHRYPTHPFQLAVWARRKKLRGRFGTDTARLLCRGRKLCALSSIGSSTLRAPAGALSTPASLTREHGATCHRDTPPHHPESARATGMPSGAKGRLRLGATPQARPTSQSRPLLYELGAGWWVPPSPHFLLAGPSLPDPPLAVDLHRSPTPRRRPPVLLLT